MVCVCVCVCVYVEKSPTLSTLQFKMESPQLKEDKYLLFAYPAFPQTELQGLSEEKCLTWIHRYNQFLTRKCSYLSSEGERITNPVLRTPHAAALAPLGNASESRSKMLQEFCSPKAEERDTVASVLLPQPATLALAHDLVPLYLVLMIRVKNKSKPSLGYSWLSYQGCSQVFCQGWEPTLLTSLAMYKICP